AEDGIRDDLVTGVQTCALPIYRPAVVIADGVAGVAEEAAVPRIERRRAGAEQLRLACARGAQLSRIAAAGGGQRGKEVIELLLRSEERRVGKSVEAGRRAYREQ